MNIEEIETNYRNGIDETLNQLQTLTLLTNRIQAVIAEVGQEVERIQTGITDVGQNLQTITRTVEEFIIEQRNE